MRVAAVLLVAFVCSGAFASNEAEPSTTTTTSSQDDQASTAASRIRQSADSDLIVKEWHSPVTFDIDAAWLPGLPLGEVWHVTDIPAFYCDNASLGKLSVKKNRPRPGVLSLTIEFVLEAQKGPSDKLVALEFTLVNLDLRLPLSHVPSMSVKEGGSFTSSVTYDKPEAVLDPYMVIGSHPRLRISMIVWSD